MHSNETVVVLHALKHLLTRIEVLETLINKVGDTISRIEQVVDSIGIGLTFNIEGLGEEDEDSDDEDSVASAPF